MALLKILDRFYERLAKKHRDKFLASFPYKVVIPITYMSHDEEFEPWVNKWLTENIGRKDRDYRIKYNYANNEYWFKKQEDSITFALRWM